MPYNLIEDIKKEIDSKESFYKTNRKLIEELDRLEPVWQAFMPDKVDRPTAHSLWVTVEKMKEVEPLLALLTHDDLSFTDSGDKYAINKNRDFRRSDGLTVYCYLTGDSCKLEQVGEEVVPKYKLVCE